MKILVTGGAGFIGSNFVLDWIAGTGGTVVNLDKLTPTGKPVPSDFGNIYTFVVDISNSC